MGYHVKRRLQLRDIIVYYDSDAKDPKNPEKLIVKYPFHETVRDKERGKHYLRVVFYSQEDEVLLINLVPH